MKRLVLVFLLTVICLVASRKIEKENDSAGKEVKLAEPKVVETTNEVPEPDEQTKVNVAFPNGYKPRLLIKRSPGKRSRERYGYGYNNGGAYSGYGGRSRGGRSRGGRSRGGRSRGGRSRGGRSRGGRSRGGRSRGGRSRYGGRSDESYGHYGYVRYGYGHNGYNQNGYGQDGYRGYYRRPYIGVIRYGGQPGSVHVGSVGQRPSGNCNCPFNPEREPSGSGEDSSYDFDYLRQWQRAFSSHPCCRQRWEVYWANSHR